jgi:putative oxidoreductase
MFMGRFSDQSYAAMRIMVGLMFLLHGATKLTGFPGPVHEGTPAFVKYLGGSIELFGGGLVMLGLFAGWAAFLCSGMMAAAYWMAHGLNHLFPSINKGELAVVYCFVFLFISTKGAGIWSLDAMRRR